MNIEKLKRAYLAPQVEVLIGLMPINLLVSMSSSAGIDDWEEGEEL